MLRQQLSQFMGGDEHLLIDSEGKARPPSEEELQTDYAAPGEDTLLPAGITYCANWKLPADGMSKHAREQAAAMACVGLPIALRNIGLGLVLSDELSEEAREVSHLEVVDFNRTLLSIKHIVLHDPHTLRTIICPGANTLDRQSVETVFRSTIVYTSLERDRIDPEFVQILNRLCQVWVPCNENADALRYSGVLSEKIRVIPYPFDPNCGPARISAPRGKETVPKGKVFYTIGKWEPRKNQHEVIGGFLLTFTPKSPESLFVKTSKFRGDWEGYPSPEDSLAYWLDSEEVQKNGWTPENVSKRLIILDRKISDADVLGIHQRGNIYVSASCGEAWDIPAFEAKLAGNRLVHVGYGGSSEYFEEGDVCISSHDAPVHHGYGWEREARWRQSLARDIGKAMKAAEPKARRVMPRTFVARFGRAAVGQMVKEAIAEALGISESELTELGGFG